MNDIILLIITCPKCGRTEQREHLRKNPVSRLYTCGVCATVCGVRKAEKITAHPPNRAWPGAAAA